MKSVYKKYGFLAATASLALVLACHAHAAVILASAPAFVSFTSTGLTHTPTDEFLSDDEIPKVVGMRMVVPEFGLATGLSAGTSAYFKWETQLGSRVTSAGRALVPVGAAAGIASAAGFDAVNWSETHFGSAGFVTSAGSANFSTAQTQYLATAPSDVPEPASVAIFGLGLLSLFALRKEKA